ncbi:MAG: baseplate J/gp47 family protein, partial [Ktedonobacteraceae bacterium]|nr:baseplate J/gp47 family protein [Ktedonobacteraceae bacterium]
VALTANPNGTAGTVASRSIVQEFRKKGSEPATGSKMLGTAKSKGFVCFTNKSDASVEIPTGSIVSASNGVQFTTTADGVVLAHNTCINDPLTFPIQAVKAGETGNVLAGSVTVIPDNSLDTIAKYNKVATSGLKLSVNNSEDIKGGGMQPVPAITDKDLNNAKTDLSNQLKGDIDGWVRNLSKDGVAGNVTTDATLVDAPPKDSTLDSGTTFPAEVAVRATVAFVSNSDIQRATLNQLNAEISKDKNFSGYAIAQDAKPPVVLSQLKKQVNANSLQINLNATAQAIPNISKETVRNIVSGKTPGEARKLLLTNIRGTQDASIQVTPSFFPWVSWWPAHIDVIILPGSTSNSPPVRT